MDSKKYLRILGIVTVLLVGVGILRNIVLPLFGSGAVTASVAFEPAENDADFQGIVADLETASLTIQSGAEFQVLSDVYQMKEPVIAIRDGNLHITQKESNGWNFFNLIGTKKCDISVTVPSDLLERIDVTSNVGEIRVEGLSLDKLTVHSDVGEVTLRDVTAASLLSVETNVGSISSQYAEGGDTVLRSDVGSIDAVFAGAEEDYRTDCTTDLGSVTVNGSNRGSFSSPAQTPPEKTILARTSVGSISLTFGR
ncbi:MAG: DUF4097 family beta strand repeat protein [Lachnospiraceae bacterium]|nr:DUF4097 family beta strand repeat protein [Lachnospiraceae bacterium]